MTWVGEDVPVAEKLNVLFKDGNLMFIRDNVATRFLGWSVRYHPGGCCTS